MTHKTSMSGQAVSTRSFATSSARRGDEAFFRARGGSTAARQRRPRRWGGGMRMRAPDLGRVYHDLDSEFKTHQANSMARMAGARRSSPSCAGAARGSWVEAQDLPAMVVGTLAHRQRRARSRAECVYHRPGSLRLVYAPLRHKLALAVRRIIEGPQARPQGTGLWSLVALGP